MNIGTPIREITIEPLTVPAEPTKKPAESPREPLPVPEREKVPV